MEDIRPKLAPLNPNVPLSASFLDGSFEKRVEEIVQKHLSTMSPPDSRPNSDYAKRLRAAVAIELARKDEEKARKIIFAREEQTAQESGSSPPNKDFLPIARG
ncbi:MAG: hypothetical protein JSR76_01230 [Verrucomicrobia bacterium]|nr:hypothetical protein [Verrucomicrobiota bacterium]